jgi:hypothetical protein
MPYISRPPRRFVSSALAACTALLAFGAVSAQAATLNTSSCEEPLVSRPFLYANDSNYYFLAPGQTPTSFEGQGWTLSSGAKISQGTLPNGSTGPVLDLPAGAKAVSPEICVTTAYPTARMKVRALAGSGNVNFQVAYGGKAPKAPTTVPATTAWTLSGLLNMSPENCEGWQLVKITLAAPGGPAGNKSDVQVDNLYIDPYVRR